MTEQISVNAAVNGLLRLAQNQLTNTLSLIEKQVPVIDEAMQAESAEFNELVDLVEKRDVEISAAQLKLHSQQEAHTAEMKEVQGQLNKANVKLGQMNVVVSGAASVEAELKKLKALNPERLQKKNKELRSDLTEKTRLLGDAQRTIKTQKGRIHDLETTVGTLTVQNTEMLEEIDHHRERRKALNGDVVQNTYHGDDGLTCYINIFEWGLTYTAQNIKAQMVNDLTWHLEVRTSYGLGIIVSITKWLTPFFPYIAAEITDNWPKDLNKDLVGVIVERCSVSHPHLVDRVDWASTVLLSEVEGLNQKHVELLADAGFNTVYAVVSTPSEKMPGLVKGLGEKSVAKVYEVLNKKVEEWEAENWTSKERFEMQ